MAIALTPEEKAQLKREDSLILPLAGADGAESAQFHNPKTGQEFVNLPIDPYHLGRHLRRGLMMGPASPELREKWEAGEADRQAANDALMAEHLDKAPPPIEATPRFEDAVAAAVVQVLEKLGVEVPSEKQEAREERKEGAKEVAPIQLELPFGETSESKTKHVVLQSPRPNLRLVE